jgi:hypothetical protein
MANGVKFTTDSAARIAKAVIGWERHTQNPRTPRGRHGAGNPLGFWAKITDTDEDRISGKYSWKAIKFKDDGSFEEFEEWGKGSHEDQTGFAREAIYDSVYVLKKSIVWMEPALGQDYYIFQYNPGPIWATIEGEDTIPARSGNEPSSVTVTVFEVGPKPYLLTEGESIDAYNCYSKAIDIPIDKKLRLELNFGTGGLLWIVGADCEQEASGS